LVGRYQFRFTVTSGSAPLGDWISTSYAPAPLRGHANLGGFCSCASPFAGLAEVDLADTLDQKFLTLKQGFVTAHSFFHAFDGSGQRPRIAMEVSDIFSLINLVSEGIGFALLPGRIASFSARIRLVPLAPKFASKQSITLLYSQRRERDPNLLALAAECRMYARRKDQAD